MTAEFSWKYNYRPGGSGAYRYYPGGTLHGAYDMGLGAFVVDHLNSSRRDLILGMSNIRRQAEGETRRRSRVDTGLMKRSVRGTGDFGTDILKISFGWEAHDPSYASFQEFGTRHGITPMHAVSNAFEIALAATKKLVGS